MESVWKGLRWGEVGTDKVEVEDTGVVSPDWVVSMAMMPSEDRKQRTHIVLFKFLISLAASRLGDDVAIECIDGARQWSSARDLHRGYVQRQRPRRFRLMITTHECTLAIARLEHSSQPAQMRLGFAPRLSEARLARGWGGI
jgi:hypothetical protein